MRHTEWYRLDADEAIALLASSDKGLSSQEASVRLQKHQRNILPRSRTFGVWLLFLRQTKNPLIFTLLGAGVLTLLVQEYLDAAVIFVAVGMNIGIGFYQEYSSNKILEHLQRLIKVNAWVLRNGRICEIDSEELVPGDIVELKTGMKVPADIRLAIVKELAIGEAILTGESRPVEKGTATLHKDVAIGDRTNMTFMGTTVDRGEGLGVVVATGSRTEIGKIAELTRRAEDETTPLQERLARVGKIISLLVFIGATIIFLVGVWEQIDMMEIFVTAVAVAVAAIPEGLPAALAVILAVSSKKISRTGGLVKKLIAAESLGSTSVICVDKTGTLTEGKMRIERLLTKAPKEKLLTVLACANEAIVEQKSETYEIRGESTDSAKLQAFLDAGLSYQKRVANMPRVAFLSFDSSTKYIASFHKPSDKEVLVYVTGSPEVCLGKSTHLETKKRRSITDADRKKVRVDYESFAARGFRMIGAAYRVIKADPAAFSEKKNKELRGYVEGLTFLGLAAVRDPIRTDVKQIMSEVKSAGLRVVMVTGDHRLTAVTIGKDLGLFRSESAVMEGFELDRLSDEELQHKVQDIDIFARVDPEHKLRIVKAWKARGESVAASGDGINDAPALKTADIGIAVASGTDVTKEAADLVLTNDSFVSIVEAIRQGRTAFYNIKKVTIFLLSSSFTELVLILGALILRIPLPLTALQILWTNLVEDVLPNFALAFEPAEKNVMKYKPIERKTQLLDAQGKGLAFGVGISTDLILLAVFLLFLNNTSYSIEYIRTFMFAALGTDTLFYVFSLRVLDRPIFTVNPLQNRYFLVAVLIGFILMIGAVYLPFLNEVLDTEPLLLHHLSWIAALGLIGIITMEIAKWFYYRKQKAL